MTKSTMSRREMLKLMAMGTASYAIASCTPSAPPAATQATGPTAAPAAAVPPTTAPAAAQAAASAPTGALRVAFPTTPSNLDPHFWVDWREQDMVWITFDTPIYREASGKFVPHLAESWKLINDNTWQLKLKQGVKFQNGEPLNAEAVKYSLDRAVDPNLKATLYSPQSMKLKGGEVVDEYTVNVILEQPLAETALHQRLSDFAMVPPAYYKSLSTADASTKPVGSGPFKMVDWVKDDHVTFEAVADYWRNDHHWGGAPRFKTLTYRVIPDVTARIAALETDAVDIIWDIPMDQVKKMTGDLRAAVVATDGRLYVGFNQTKPYLKDKRVRQAFNYAINWEPINQALYYGAAPRMNSWVAPQSVNHNTALKAYPYDPDKAKALLLEAEFPMEQKLKLTAITSPPEYAQIAQAVAADLEKVGLSVEVEVVENSILRKQLTGKEVADLWLISYGGGADDGQGALTTLQKDFVLSAYAWDNPEWESLFADLSKGAALDAEKRRTTMLKLQEIAVDDPPVVYLTYVPKAFAMGKRVKSWEPRFDQLFVPWEVVLA